MRCFICDRVIDEPNFNADHNDYEPCETCQRVIEETVGQFEARPSVDEDELGAEDILDFYYHQIRWSDYEGDNDNE